MDDCSEILTEKEYIKYLSRYHDDFLMKQLYITILSYIYIPECQNWGHIMILRNIAEAFWRYDPSEKENDPENYFHDIKYFIDNEDDIFKNCASIISVALERMGYQYNISCELPNELRIENLMLLNDERESNINHLPIVNMDHWKDILSKYTKSKKIHRSEM